MTEDELKSIPECGGIGLKDVGNGLKIPYVRENFVLQEEILLNDSEGNTWLVGFAYGQRWKRRIL